MPPKLDRCVRSVTPRTGERRAYAICTASLQRAGVIPRKSKTMSTKMSARKHINPLYGRPDAPERRSPTERKHRRQMAALTFHEREALIRFAKSHSPGWKKNLISRMESGQYMSDDVRAVAQKLGASGIRKHVIPRESLRSQKVANPSASCPRQSPKFNAYQGRTVKYRKKSYEIEGCGIGRTAKRSIGKQEEGTYALRNLKTGKKKYVAKRVIRDLAYHRGGKAILGMPKKPRAKKPVKNPSRKMSAADKSAFVERMARARAAKGR